MHLGEDPFEKFVGSVKSNIPDWTDQHDKYLGESLQVAPEEAWLSKYCPYLSSS
jgi:hypothetical protein